VPTLKRLVPVVVSLWNLLKGDVDDMSRLIAHMSFATASLTAGQSAIWRLVLIALVQVYRLWQVATTTIREDDTWDQYAKRRRRVSYQEFVGRLIVQLDKFVDEHGSQSRESSGREMGMEVEEEEEGKGGTVSLRSRVVHRAVGVMASGGLLRDYRTPDGESRSKRRKSEGFAGPCLRPFLIKRTKGDIRRCFNCGTKTWFACLACGKAFCVDFRDRRSVDSRTKVHQIVIERVTNEDGREVRTDEVVEQYVNSCFYQAHSYPDICGLEGKD